MKRVVVAQRRLPHYRERFFEDLRVALLKRGVELDLLVGQSTEDEVRKNDSGALSWAKIIPTSYAFGGRICWLPVRSNVGKADLVIVTQENKLIENLLHLALPRRHQLAFWGHGANLQSRRPGGFREGFKRWTARRVDWWFAYTDLSAQLIGQSGFPREKITVLNNSIDTIQLRQGIDDVSNEERRKFLSEVGLLGRNVGVYVGSLYREKHIDFLLQSVLRVRDRVKDFELIVAGAGVEVDVVVDFCSHHSWAKYVGPVRGRDKSILLSCAAVLLNPGAVGLGILDSFAAKAPLLTTDCGAHGPEIAYLNNYSNGIISNFEIESFARDCIHVLEDEGLKRRLRDGCAASAEFYTLDRMVDQFADGIEQCLALN